MKRVMTAAVAVTVEATTEVARGVDPVPSPKKPTVGLG